MDQKPRGIDGALRDFGEKRLNAAAYPDCRHVFIRELCRACGGATLEIAIEVHEASKLGNFRGIVHSRCRACGTSRDLPSLVCEGDVAVSTERLACACGSQEYYIGVVERWEDWGFFDEATMVAICAGCGRLRVVVDTE